MKIASALSAVFLFVYLDSTQGDKRKCSPEVLNKINLLWAKDGKPKDLLKDAVAAKKQNIIKTSDGYYPLGTTCAYTLFSEDGAYSTLSKLVLGKLDEETLEVYEADGAVIETDTGVKRYHVFNKDGVAAWYKCADGLDATDGEPEGAIKVPNGVAGAAYSQDDVYTAKQKLEAIGVTLTTNYSPIC